MSHDEYFARPSVHFAINFGIVKRSLLELSQSTRLLSTLFIFFHTFSFQHSVPPSLSVRSALQLVSSATLCTFLLFDTRTQSKPGPSRIYPSTSPRLNRGCQRLGTWIACLIKKKATAKAYAPVFSLYFLASPRTLGSFLSWTSTRLTHPCTARFSTYRTMRLAIPPFWALGPFFFLLFRVGQSTRTARRRQPTVCANFSVD